MIGVFDSGVGGLTVVGQLINRLPGYRLVYFGDTARLPYGTKSAETVSLYARQDAAFLLSRGARLVVVACNSASAVALDALAAWMPVPVVGVIEPAVRAAAAATRNGRIGVIGTRATAASEIYPELFGRDHPGLVIHTVATPLLVPLVEEDWLDQPETEQVIRRYLQPLLQQGIDTLILACTHYPLLRSLIERVVGPEVALVDPAVETAAGVERLLADRPELAAGMERGMNHRFYLSDITPHFRAICTRFLGGEIAAIEKVELNEVELAWLSGQHTGRRAEEGRG